MSSKVCEFSVQNVALYAALPIEISLCIKAQVSGLNWFAPTETACLSC